MSFMADEALSSVRPCAAEIVVSRPILLCVLCERSDCHLQKRLRLKAPDAEAVAAILRPTSHRL